MPSISLPTAFAAVSAGGNLLGGISKASQAQYQAQVAKNNAIIAGQNATYSAAAGSANAETAGLQARSQQANLRAGIAANNLDVNSGSPATVQQSQREIGDLAVSNVAQKSALDVYGYQAQGVNYEAQAKMDQAEVVPDVIGGAASAGGSLLSNASSVPQLYAFMTGG